MAFHRQVGPSTQPRLRIARLRRDARDVALRFSQEPPLTSGPRGGVLRADLEAIREAFRLCYEVLKMTDNAKKVMGRSGRWAILARTNENYEWVQIESTLGEVAADALLLELEDDGLRADYIADAMEDQRDWGEDAPA